MDGSITDSALAVWLGLVLGKIYSGGKQTLSGTSKRVDAFLRTLRIHGARSVLFRGH